METLAKRLAAFGKNHPTVPGIQIAWLEKDQLWYVALHVYQESYGRGREVLASTKQPDLNVAINELLAQIPEQ